MLHQYQARNAASGVEDLVLLTKVTDSQIVENLQKRYMNDFIYTYIGSVLIAVNPYKGLPYFTEKEIELYHGSSAHENPPHIYAIAENMFQKMISDEENQCCIISGESGAGKTESSKLLMNYIASISGKGGSEVEETKKIILESNPLLEAFGNAKTLRNNNSSRFGKYFQINFTRGGQPSGGNISNFLLEKSRVVGVKPGERNFHIFYQLTKGANSQEKEWFGLGSPDYYSFLNQSKTFDVDGMDDVKELQETKESMAACGIEPNDQLALFQIVAGILHLGNIDFIERSNQASLRDENSLAYPAHLLGVDPKFLKEKLLSRLMQTGGGQRGSTINVSLGVEQANNTRDALAKALYSRMFDWIIQAVNKTIHKYDTSNALCLGVLDIYGFEIFEKNGFEQLCINYVNEKLQQVFIELTLKSEQEEYVREGISWTPIDYFNNKIVVDLIEGKRPVGIMGVLDDICAQLHAQTEGADVKFIQKLDTIVGQNPHYHGGNNHFTVKHYAGTVNYDSDGFCEANKDTLYKDLILLAQSSNNAFIRNLFPENVQQDDKKRPTTAGYKIRNQCNELVDTLMKCTPSYIRCIKPNEKKRPRDWDNQRVEHQVRYLNLRENINVRRAGFCYRNIFEKFVRRYGILTPQTFPHWNGAPRDGVMHILNYIQMDPSQFQMGKTKVFVKAPETLFSLEELRERKYHMFCVKIQRAYRRYKARKFYIEMKKKTLSLVVGRKERNRNTINREFLGDYLNIMGNATLKTLMGKRERSLFCDRITKYDRRWKSTERELIITENSLIMIGQEKIENGPNKGKLQKVIKRRLDFNQIGGISVSELQDNFFVLHVPGEYDNVLENRYKTELITVLAGAFQKATRRNLDVKFCNSIQYSVKKTSWASSGMRTLNFRSDPSKLIVTMVNNGSSTTEIAVPPGLPKDTQPNISSSPVKSAGPSMRSGFQQAQRPVQHAAYQPPRPPMNQLPSNVPPMRPPQFNATQARPNMPTNMPPPMRPSPMQTTSQRNLNPAPIGQTNFAAASTPNLVAINNNNNNNAPVKSFTNTNSNFGSASNLERPRPPRLMNNNRPVPPKPKVDQCRALYTYQAREADELSLVVGDVITIVSKDNEGWWTGMLKGRRGLFPANYVELI